MEKGLQSTMLLMLTLATPRPTSAATDLSSRVLSAATQIQVQPQSITLNHPGLFTYRNQLQPQSTTLSQPGPYMCHNQLQPQSMPLSQLRPFTIHQHTLNQPDLLMTMLLSLMTFSARIRIDFMSVYFSNYLRNQN